MSIFLTWYQSYRIKKGIRVRLKVCPNIGNLSKEHSFVSKERVDVLVHI